MPLRARAANQPEFPVVTAPAIQVSPGDELTTFMQLSKDGSTWTVSGVDKKSGKSSVLSVTRKRAGNCDYDYGPPASFVLSRVPRVLRTPPVPCTKDVRSALDNAPDENTRSPAAGAYASERARTRESMVRIVGAGQGGDGRRDGVAGYSAGTVTGFWGIHRTRALQATSGGVAAMLVNENINVNERCALMPATSAGISFTNVSLSEPVGWVTRTNCAGNRECDCGNTATANNATGTRCTSESHCVATGRTWLQHDDSWHSVQL